MELQEEKPLWQPRQRQIRHKAALPIETIYKCCQAREKAANNLKLSGLGENSDRTDANLTACLQMKFQIVRLLM